MKEESIKAKFITPAIISAGWDLHKQIDFEKYFTDGRIHVRGNMSIRGKRQYADYVLYYKPNVPIAIIEAKDNKHSIGAGMQQGLEYSDILDIPFVFSSNGDGFLFHDKTVDTEIVKELTLEQFPSPEELWIKYCNYKGFNTPEQKKIVEQDYFSDGSGRTPRYYQKIAINRTIEAIAKGQDRILLVMATGTGKTYTAFQIIHRLWKCDAKKRILFLADRTALIDQTRRGDFKHFKDSMTIIKKKVITRYDGSEELVSNNKRGIDSSDKAYEIFLGLYQGLTNAGDVQDAYKDFSKDFFDLIVIDECHRGSSAEDSAWREILKYFSSATHIGLTATPKEKAKWNPETEQNEITDPAYNIKYFGEPIYTYTLKQGINDGFLAPYRVVRVGLNVDLEGWRPPKGYKDKNGDPVEDRIYNRKDFDRNIVFDERRKLVAHKITEFLKGTDRFSKTIMFCTDIEHAEGMVTALTNENGDLIKENRKYIMQITGDNDEGKKELDNFINPEEKYPVITTTSKLMTTGVDAKTCKLIVLDSNIKSMTEFKQIIGRGTRIDEEYGKTYFTILDFRNVTDLFADPEFDGEPVSVYKPDEEDDLGTIEEDEIEIAEPIIEEDPETGEDIEVLFPEPDPEPYSSTGDNSDYPIISEPREKIFVNGVEVSVLNERNMYFDGDGKPITVSLKEYTKEQITKNYRSLDDFLNKWNEADKKEAIICELEEQGILVDELVNAVGRECDLFDIICHTAFDMPPLTRKERAENVKKRNYFTKYGDSARAVLEALLDKYADEDVRAIEDIKILKISPFDQFGSLKEIVENRFNGKNNYLTAIRELEQELYKEAL